MQAVIFDLDGTLVDSAPEITETMRDAWNALGFGRPFPAERLRIGPPIFSAVRELDPSLSDEQCNTFIAAFRERYDRSDFSRTPPFSPVVPTLDALRERGVPCFIATNKRLPPTLRIAEKWFAGRFSRIAACDGSSPAGFPAGGDKRSMLDWIVAEERLERQKTSLVGDTPGDVAAARGAGVVAIGVTWGYESADALRAAGADALASDAASLLRLLC